MTLSIDEQKARDALAFEPLPASPWVRVDREAIVVTVRYHERLSRLLRSMPGARWDPERRQWRLPFAAADALRAALPELDRLAAVASEAAERETERRLEEAAAWRASFRARPAPPRMRPLRREFLLATPGPTLHCAVESIGAAPWPQLRRAGVAQIFAGDGAGRWLRHRLHPARDYSRANAVGSRGVMLNFWLDQGPVYEIAAPRSWRRVERRFVRGRDGRLGEMTEEELIACLES